MFKICMFQKIRKEKKNIFFYMRPTLGPVGQLNLYEANPVATGSTLWARAGLSNKQINKYIYIYILGAPRRLMRRIGRSVMPKETSRRA